MSEIPNLEAMPASALSREIADAAEELTCRIELGEFDDLDEAEMSELRTLSAQMTHWAEHAWAIEQRLVLAGGRATGSNGRVAFCN